MVGIFFVQEKDRMTQGMDYVHLLQNRAQLWAIVELGNKYRLSQMWIISDQLSKYQFL